jgi:hypothetical protein
MTFPPKPPPLTTHPAGKPGIPDHLVENARRAMELAEAEAEVSLRMERVIHRMTVHLQSSVPARRAVRSGWLTDAAGSFGRWA